MYLPVYYFTCFYLIFLPVCPVCLCTCLVTCLSGQFLVRVEGWVQACSEGSLPSATAELEAATKKHQELNEEISANYTQVSVWLSEHLSVCLNIYCLSIHITCLSVQTLNIWITVFFTEHLSVWRPVCLTTLPVCLQVSESGKALLDVLQRCPATDSDDSATKPDFTAATHGIMGVLHQVMQVRPTCIARTVFVTDRQTDRQRDR